eukprot:6019343-Amphidinium_carterae.1
MRACLHRFVQEDAVSPSLAWFARVPSKSNPADAPSRGEGCSMEGVSVCRVGAASQCEECWRLTLAGDVRG